MIISREFAAKKIKETEEHDYLPMMFVNIEHIAFGDDIKKFEWGVHLMNHMLKAGWATEMYEKMGVPKKIDCSILNEAMKTIYGGMPFNKEQKGTYFEFIKCIEKWNRGIFRLHSFETPMPEDLELYLLGLPLEVIQENEEYSKVSSYFTEIYSDYLNDVMTVQSFLSRTKELISVYLK